jgi:hypothetical protein
MRDHQIIIKDESLTTLVAGKIKDDVLKIKKITHSQKQNQGAIQ